MKTKSQDTAQAAASPFPVSPTPSVSEGSGFTKGSLAAAINGRQYRQEVTREERKAAAAAGLVILYGASDDLLEFDGAIYDEVGAYDGATVYINPDCSIHNESKPGSIKVEAVWCPDEPVASWLVKVDGPHSPFDVIEDDELYCRGAVIDLAEVFPPHTAPADVASDLKAALAGLLDHYLSLVNSGDAGSWNPEEEPEVIAARAALSLASGSNPHA